MGFKSRDEFEIDDNWESEKDLKVGDENKFVREKWSTAWENDTKRKVLLGAQVRNGDLTLVALLKRKTMDMKYELLHGPRYGVWLKVAPFGGDEYGKEPPSMLMTAFP